MTWAGSGKGMLWKDLGIFDHMPFGEYKGKLIGEVIEENPGRIEWMLSKQIIRLDEQAYKYLKEQE